MELSIVGAGYVGLVTAACLVKMGHTVRCIDIDAARIERLRQGIIPIHEPGLDELVAAGLEAGTLSFHTELDDANGTPLAIIAVGTLDEHDEWTDRLVRAAVMQLARDPEGPRQLVIRSTLLPGTARSIAQEVRAIDARIRIAVNPEFTREATAVNDFLMPDRVVVGVAEPRSDEADGALVADLRTLYEPLDAPIVVTDLTSAEMIKMASNVFLASKISFANELARLCAAAGADVLSVVDGMGLDHRIGRSFLTPGPGYGGSCFPSQARALPEFADSLNVATPLMSAIAPTNVAQAAWMLEAAIEALGRPASSVRAAVLGLTFKAGTDDLRESPGLRVIRSAVEQGMELTTFDPMAGERGAAQLAREGVSVAASPDIPTACTGVDVVLVTTEWPEFHAIDWTTVAPLMRGRLVVDARSIVDADAAERAGLQVLSLTGRRRAPSNAELVSI